MNCKNCGHTTHWHLYSDGPHPRICNMPKCKCDNYETEE